MVTKLLKSVSCALLLALGVNANAQLFNFDSDLQGWSEDFSGQGTVTHNATGGAQNTGALELTRTTNNANYGFRNGSATTSTGIDATANKFIRIVFKNTTNATQLRVSGLNDDGTELKTDLDGFITASISANLDEFVELYIDMSSHSLWKGDLKNFYMLVRMAVPDAAGGSFILDEIEFVSSAPVNEFSEFIKNPSWEDASGTSFLSGSKSFATRSVTLEEAQSGTKSLKFNYTADATDGGPGVFWSFSSFSKDYTPDFLASTIVRVKMWVKTNRTVPISVSARVRLQKDGVNIGTGNPIGTVVTTNTAMEWEELTFDLTAGADFDNVQLWFAINNPGDTSDLNMGDKVYFDNFSAEFDTTSLSTTAGAVIEGASVDASQGTITVSGANLDAVYSITGQEVSATGLSSGVYIVKISKGNLQEAVKVIL